MFSFNWLEREREKEEVKEAEVVKNSLDSAKIKALSRANDKGDSAEIENAFNIAVQPYLLTLKADTAGTTDEWKEKMKKKEAKRKKKAKERYNFNFTNPDQKYASIEQYDSVQKALPASERDNWLERKAKHREIDVHERYNGNQQAMLQDLMQKFVHLFPYLLFVSLPLYALYLKLLYIRRKQYLYVTHGIFLIYLYIFTFIDLLVYFGFMKIRETLHWGWIGWLEAAVLLYGVWYAYKAMRKFYGQGTGKTLLKFFILNTLAFWSLIFLFTGFFLFAVFKF
jgi:hypothetical protein